MSNPDNIIKIVGRECVFVTHLPAIPDVREDTHLIKEKIHYSDGTMKRNLRVLKNFQRPFWITKPTAQNHKQKKESEILDKTIRYLSTESDLGKSVASRLGQRYIGRTKLRDVCDSPFVYGIDVSAATMIKEQYQAKYPEYITPLSIAVYDTEVDTYTEEIILATVAMKDKIKTYIHERLFDNKRDLDSRLRYLYEKHIPKTELFKNIKIEYIVCKSEIDIVQQSMMTAHEWGPDILAMWNASYDIEHIVEACNRANIDPKDVFSDPALPPELRHFRLKYGATSKLTESGKYKPLDPQERWHNYTSASTFYMIDAMAAYNFVRVGAKAVPGGYSLTNILRHELGEKYIKLEFLSEETLHLHGIDWHRYMLANKPLEYTIYNQWDCLSMLLLDDKTKDLATNVPTLSGVSSFDVFNSGPKRIVDGLHFFYIDHNQVLGCRPSRSEGDKVLGLDNWIAILESYLVVDNGARVIKESPEARTNIRFAVFDADQVSGYPSDGQAANVSRETTTREILDIEGIEKDVFKNQNINILFGKVNTVEYATTMMKFPELTTLRDKIRELYPVEDSLELVA